LVFVRIINPLGLQADSLGEEGIRKYPKEIYNIKFIMMPALPI
jgi:hypothetical protein